MSCSWTVGLLKVVLTQMNFDQRNFTVVMPASHRLLLTCWLVYSPTSAVQRRQLPGAAFSRVVWLKGEKHTEIIHQPPKLTHFQTLQRFEHKHVWRRFLFFCQLVFTHVPSSLPSLDAVARLQLYIIPEWSIWGEVSALAIPQNSCIKYHPLQADVYILYLCQMNSPVLSTFRDSCVAGICFQQGLEMLICCIGILFLVNIFYFFFAAFTKMITINGQEYHLQLVDTAGQVL